MSISGDHDKQIAALDEIQRKANALEYESEKTIVLAKEEQKLHEGQKLDSVRQEAGAEEIAKKEMNAPKAKGSTEAEVYGEAGAHASGIATLEIAKTGYDLLSDSDPASGTGHKTVEQDIKSLAQKKPGLHLADTKKSTFGQSIKTPFIEDTADGLLGRMKMSKAFGKGFKAKNQAGKLGGKYIATEQEVGGFKLASVKDWSMAQYQKEQTMGVKQVQEAHAAPQEPGGMGGPQRPQQRPMQTAKLDMDLSKGPKGYKYPEEDATDSEGWVS